VGTNAGCSVLEVERDHVHLELGVELGHGSD
jgi:hypothetical protein